MKKLLILIFALIFSLLLCIGIHAEEVPPGEDNYEVGDIIPEEALGELADDIHKAETEENYGESSNVPPEVDDAGGVNVDTVLTRVFEWWDLYKEEIQSVAGLIISGLFALLGKHLTNKITNLKKDTNDQIANTSKASNDKINELVDAYNKNAELIKELIEKTDILIDKVDEVDNKTLETEEIEVSIARMLDMAYSHSRLPNGTKDVINTEYAQIERRVHGYAITEGEADEEED